MNDLDTISSLSALSMNEEYCTPEQINLSGGGVCALDEFDSKRSKDLAGKIWELNEEIAGGKGNPAQIDKKTIQADDNIETVEARQGLIHRMALSGGQTPEKWEPAAIISVGTQRRTKTGIYQVGWEFEPKNGGYPQKKWFPVSYNYASLPYRFSGVYDGWKYGIPSVCPLWKRYSYVCWNGCCNKAKEEDKKKNQKDTKDTQEQTDTSEQNKNEGSMAALGGGGMYGGPFGYRGGQKDEPKKMELEFRMQMDFDEAIEQANRLKIVITNTRLKELYRCYQKCSDELKQIDLKTLNNQQKNTLCRQVLSCVECARKLCRQDAPKDQKMYLKSLFNVMVLQLQKACPKVASEIMGILR